MLPGYTSPNQAARPCSCSSRDARPGWMGAALPRTQSIPGALRTMGCFAPGGAGRAKKSPAAHTRAQAQRTRKAKSATDKAKKKKKREMAKIGNTKVVKTCETGRPISYMSPSECHCQFSEV